MCPPSICLVPRTCPTWINFSGPQSPSATDPLTHVLPTRFLMIAELESDTCRTCWHLSYCTFTAFFFAHQDFPVLACPTMYSNTMAGLLQRTTELTGPIGARFCIGMLDDARGCPGHFFGIRARSTSAVSLVSAPNVSQAPARHCSHRSHSNPLSCVLPSTGYPQKVVSLP